MLEVYKVLRKIVQVVQRLSCVFELCAAYPPASILYNFFDMPQVDNFPHFLNLLLILVHILRLMSPPI